MRFDQLEEREKKMIGVVKPNHSTLLKNEFIIFLHIQSPKGNRFF